MCRGARVRVAGKRSACAAALGEAPTGASQPVGCFLPIQIMADGGVSAPPALILAMAVKSLLRASSRFNKSSAWWAPHEHGNA